MTILGHVWRCHGSHSGVRPEAMPYRDRRCLKGRPERKNCHDPNSSRFVVSCPSGFCSTQAHSLHAPAGATAAWMRQRLPWTPPLPAASTPWPRRWDSPPQGRPCARRALPQPHLGGPPPPP
eukprot:58741-Rhodomonas_salina.1